MPKAEQAGETFSRFQSLVKRLLAVPKAEADKQKHLSPKKQSRPKHHPARG